MLTFFGIGFMIVLLVIFERSIASRIFSGEKSDHFNGTHFFNAPSSRARSPRPLNASIWKWMLSRRRGAWNTKAVEPIVPAERVHDGIAVTYINHATVLIQCYGVNIITDPVFSYRVSPLPFIGPARYAAPGVHMKDLPPIDIVLLSHNHYDHMDIASLRELQRVHTPRIYTGLGNRAYLARHGIPGAYEMDWWQEYTHAPFIITAVPARHFSARSVSDRNHTLWCGFVVQTPGGALYFAGDTGYGEFVQDIAHRFSPIQLALIPIGAYEPAWMMQEVHTNPSEALELHDMLTATTSIGIHHGTFRLTDEAQDEPGEHIGALRGERDFRVLPNGGAVLLHSKHTKAS